MLQRFVPVQADLSSWIGGNWDWGKTLWLEKVRGAMGGLLVNQDDDAVDFRANQLWKKVPNTIKALSSLEFFKGR